MAATILLYGFAPFGGETRNPSGEIARRWHGRTIGTVRVRSIVLPVARKDAFSALRGEMGASRPLVVVGLGVADGRSAISVERRAVNREDGRDELGDERNGTPIAARGPEELLATIDPERVADAIRASGVPALTSEDAGTFLCNHVYYRVLAAARRLPAVRRPAALFLHLPALPETVARRGTASPSMSLATARRGVAAALRFAARTCRDGRGLDSG